MNDPTPDDLLQTLPVRRAEPAAPPQEETYTPPCPIDTEGAADGSTTPTAVARPEEREAVRQRSSPALRGVVHVPGYEILGELGRGGMGVVYQARHLALKRTVALKMIRAGGHADETELARFRTEAEAVARLQHSNIVQIHEVGECDGLPYVSLEFVEGGNLAQKDVRQSARRPGGGAAGGDAGRGRATGAQPKHRPPRPQAGQRAADGRRRAEDHGLRPGETTGRGRRPDAGRGGDGHARLHGARAGRRKGARRRAGGGHVRAGGDPLRVPDGPASVQGRQRAGHPGTGADARAGRAAPVAAGHSPRPGDDLSEMPAKRAGAPLHLRRGPGGGPAGAGARGSRSGRGRSGASSVRSSGRAGDRRRRRCCW